MAFRGFVYIIVEKNSQHEGQPKRGFSYIPLSWYTRSNISKKLADSQKVL